MGDEGAASVRVSDAIRDAARRLTQASDTPRLDAEWLMAHALGSSRSDLLLRHMQDAAPTGFAELVVRRQRREPVAYILGQQDFLGRSFAVSPAVLIPRSDSESVVLAALAAAPDARRVLDLGTGSGALLPSLLAELPAARGCGVDRSGDALAIARRNAEVLGLADRIEFVRADWSEPGWHDGLGRFDLVIANPPYVETDAALAADVRDFEPAGALFAGADGLDDYRILIPCLPGLLAQGATAVLEIGAQQAKAVARLGEEAGFTATVRPDLAGRDRAVILTP